jgi:hypothetical protein
MRSGALSDVQDLTQFLEENETLFVEHKTGLKEKGFQVAKAVCSFANTLGGWVLVGVTDGRPNAGEPGGWDPIAPEAFTDRVRQALRDNKVDPIPSFAATVRHHGPHALPVGVVRVYESYDTPHVMGNGQVFVRSVAEDRDQTRVYRPGGVETQSVLVQLANRGQSGSAKAKDLLRPDRAPLAAQIAGMSSSHAAVNDVGVVSVRAVPLTGDRLADWAISARALEVLEPAARRLACRTDDTPIGPPTPYASGISIRAQSSNLLPGQHDRRSGAAVVGTDAAGLICAAITLDPTLEREDPVLLSLDGFRDLLVSPLLHAVCNILEGAEMYGRVLLQLNVGNTRNVLLILEAEGPKKPPPAFPAGGTLSLPLEPGRHELQALAEDWRSDFGRAMGYATYRP